MIRWVSSFVRVMKTGFSKLSRTGLEKNEKQSGSSLVSWRSIASKLMDCRAIRAGVSVLNRPLRIPNASIDSESRSDGSSPNRPEASSCGPTKILPFRKVPAVMTTAFELYRSPKWVSTPVARPFSTITRSTWPYRNVKCRVRCKSAAILALYRCLSI